MDLLAAVSGGRNNLQRSQFSIYSHRRLAEIWLEGNAFAWHLHLEAKPIFLHDGNDYLKKLGEPSKYTGQRADCQKFIKILGEARNSIERDRASATFDLSTAFLAARNFSTCFLLGRGQANFSRNVALDLMGSARPFSITVYRSLERARLLCTRGIGESLANEEERAAIESLPELEHWMKRRLEDDEHIRLQQQVGSATRNGETH